MAGEFEPFVARLMERFLPRDGIMLDVGCGPATYRRACRCRYVGVDASDEPYGPDLPRAPDVVAPGDRLPFRPESFDLVMCKSTLYYLADASAALREFHRVLKRQGRVLVIDYNRRTHRATMRRLNVPRPCWTQAQLRRLVRQSGFSACRILSAAKGEMGAFERLWRPLAQELLGTWAIVVGEK